MDVVQKHLREIPRAVKETPAPNDERPLYGLFRDIISKDKKNIPQLLRLVKIISSAQRPLNPKELYVALYESYDLVFDSVKYSDRYLEKHVLEVSKGLAEVTKSREPTVQFIHETVREFLHDDRLEIISVGSESVSGHELMKTACLNRFCAPLTEHLEFLARYKARGQYRNTRVSKVTTEQQQEFQEQANDKFPLLQYASKNVFLHADEAQAIGIPQDGFLESFPLADWVPVYNLFERFSTRRYNGPDSPLLYILADHGCNNLIKCSPASREDYGRKIANEEFTSALSCAIYTGRSDTVWTLVGLDPKFRPPEIVKPEMRHMHEDRSMPLVELCLQLGDAQILRKALQDGHILKSLPGNRVLREANSERMVDLLVEYSESTLNGFSQGSQPDPSFRQALDTSAPNNTLPFLRHALEQKPSLLTASIWDGHTMFDYAIRKEFRQLVSLYLEYSGVNQLALNNYLHRAAATGRYAIMVEDAHLRGADLGSQDEHGQTALHLAVRLCSSEYLPADRERTLDYLLARGPAHAHIRDCHGQNALDTAVHQPYELPFRLFLQAGFDPNTVATCNQCNGHTMPWIVAVSLARNEEVLQAMASDKRCNLNGRDSLGRTALSWCFAHRHGNRLFHDSACSYYQSVICTSLLQYPAVDVNSRDDLGYTILEHCIRHPCISTQFACRSFVETFFRSEKLDPNLRTSNEQSPLELIVALYDTWPAEFGDIDREWYLANRQNLMIKGHERQQAFSQHLIETLRLLLGTGKVDIEIQRRCTQLAPPALQGIISNNIRRQLV